MYPLYIIHFIISYINNYIISLLYLKGLFEKFLKVCTIYPNQSKCGCLEDVKSYIGFIGKMSLDFECYLFTCIYILIYYIMK